MPKIHRLTRAELCDKFWQVSVSQLALEFGPSDRGLSKLCELQAAIRRFAFSNPVCRLSLLSTACLYSDGTGYQ